MSREIERDDIGGCQLLPGEAPLSPQKNTRWHLHRSLVHRFQVVYIWVPIYIYYIYTYIIFYYIIYYIIIIYIYILYIYIYHHDLQFKQVPNIPWRSEFLAHQSLCRSGPTAASHSSERKLPSGGPRDWSW